ncbi:alpha-latrotoxin-Lh1a-like [Rhodamnia argentea]|uniref:Alpha-latrotoxin-Lh1a-like n=1 Tax=Rhodamnia argentea TaxID=178133 RepID=A0A8B8PEQ7_9MYRT|nr:alpha-latrotoxin-Lh1a-like [Rhodamnia argentea]
MNLQEAIAADNVDELYRLLGQQGNQDLLDCAPDGPFPTTPLHEAADQGKTKVAVEIAILKPLFTRMLNRGGHSPMHLALKNRHYHIARALMALDPELIRVRGQGGITPLHFVAKEKGANEQENVEFVELLAKFLFACKSSIKDLTIQCETAVHIAVKNHNIKAFEVLFGWLKQVCPTEILDWKDENGNTVLDIAVSKGRFEIVDQINHQQAIAADNVDELYDLLKQAGNRNLLDCAPDDPFPNTPLHNAAERGKTEVVMEIAILKPSFTRMLNRGGDSPMHLALKSKHYHTVRAPMILDPELIRVRGRGGITPLHFVAKEKGADEQENVELVKLLAEFLCSCKSSIEDLTSRYETAVHVAVENRNLKAFEVLFGWLKRVNLTEILNWKDQEGDTVYDIASCPESQPEIIKLLKGNKKEAGKIKLLIAKMIRGAACVANCCLKISISQFLSMELTTFERWKNRFNLEDESARTIITGIATLIATATYQAALSPPGGYWGASSSNPPANSTVATANSSGIAVEKPHQAGKIILSGEDLYWFAGLNTTIFLASIATIWITAIPGLPHTLPVYLLTYLLSGAYLATAITGFPKSDVFGVNIAAGLCITLLLVGSTVPAFLWLNYSMNKLRVRIDAPGRYVHDFLELKDRK